MYVGEDFGTISLVLLGVVPSFPPDEVKSIGSAPEFVVLGLVLDRNVPPISSRSSTRAGPFDLPLFDLLRDVGSPAASSCSSSPASSSSLSIASPLPATPSPRPPLRTLSRMASSTPFLHSSSLSIASVPTSPIPSGNILLHPVSLAIHLSTSLACEQKPACSVGHPALSPKPNTEYPSKPDSGAVSMRKS